MQDFRSWIWKQYSSILQALLVLESLPVKRFEEKGIPIVINTDSHTTEGFDVMRYGVYQARRAGLEKKDVANTRTFKQLQKMLRNRG